MSDTLLKIQITEEANTLGMAFADGKDEPIHWNSLSREGREHILDMIALTYKFLNSHLEDDAPNLPEG